jgi:hypothetical protein
MTTTAETATGPEVLTPDAADKKTRKADGTTTDPEAPYGWMKDPKTGETRPKKRPGKQGSKTAEPPPTRPTNKARTRTRPASSAPGGGDFAKPIGELCQGVWMIFAAVPDVSMKLGPVDLHAISTRLKAQAAVMNDNSDGLVNGLNMVAQHNETFRKGVNKLADESGPAWILPAMMVLLPFVGQSVAMWRAPIAGDVELMAKATEAQFDEIMNGALRAA